MDIVPYCAGFLKNNQLLSSKLCNTYVNKSIILALSHNTNTKNCLKNIFN